MSNRLQKIPAKISSGVEKNHTRMIAMWTYVREALAGTERDFTSGKINKAIFLLALPMVLEMIMESVFAVADIFFVSKLGPGAVATVGITESLLTIVYSLAVGLSTATTAIISRRIGEKNPDGAAVAAVQAILAGIGASLLISIPGFIWAEDILRLMGASEEIIQAGFLYPKIMLGFNVVIMLLFVINAVFRSAGDAAIAMRVLWLANLINLILDPCLIFGLGPFPELGIHGAAVATNIGRGTAVLFQMVILIKGKKRVRIKRRHLKICFDVMKKLVRLSFGGIGQSLIATSSWIGMVRIISAFGSEVMAGYTIAIRIVLFSILPSWGLSNAASTLVGQNLGAKKPDRAEKSVWRTGAINMSFMGSIAMVFIIYPDFFIRLFITEPAVVSSGATALRFLSYGFIVYALGMVVVQAFNGAGDTMTPTIINFFCFWLFEIPLAYLLSFPAGLKEKGVYIAILAAETCMAASAYLIFRRGKWKLRKI